MKILIPADGEDIKDKVDSHLTKAKYFIFMDSDKDVWEVIENKFIDQKGNTIQKIIAMARDLKVEAIIVKNIDQEAFDLFSKEEIKIFIADKENIKEAIDRLKKQELAQIFKPTKKN